MSTELAVDQFLSLLGRSCLLPEQKVQEIIDEFSSPDCQPTDSAKIAEELVSRKVLTKWQADMLLQGKHRGFILGPYCILEPLGKGGMGAVFLAEHQMMRRRSAIKVLPSDHKTRDPSLLDRFYREAQAVAALDHPNIVRAYDVNKAVENKREIHYLVMEYVDGQDLQHVVADQGPLGYREAAGLIRQAAAGLAHAHEAGLVHRDVKPANLLVDSKGVVKVLDLGLAMFFTDAGQASLTSELGETVLGTADYLAPEQAMDSHGVDARADIYSLGQTFYFLLTGHPPFPTGTVAQRLMAHQMKEPEPVDSTRPDAPLSLLAILKKMIAKKPDDRYQTAKEVALALDDWLQGHGEGSGLSLRRPMGPREGRLGGASHRDSTHTTLSHAVDTDLELAPLDDELKGRSSSVRLSGSSARISGSGRLPGGISDSQAGGSRDRLLASQSDALAPSQSVKPKPPADDWDDSEEGDEYSLSGETPAVASPSTKPASDPVPQPSTTPMAEDDDLFSAPLPAAAPLPSPLPAPGAPIPRKKAKQGEPGGVGKLLESGLFWIAVAVVLVLVLIIAIWASRPAPEATVRRPASAQEDPSAAESESATQEPEKANRKKPGLAKSPPASSGKPKAADSPKQQHTAGQKKKSAEAGAARPKRGRGKKAATQPSANRSAVPGEGAGRDARPAAGKSAAPADGVGKDARPTKSDAKAVDVQSLFAGVRKIAFELKSADRSPASKLNLTIQHEAEGALDRVGMSVSREEPAVLHVELKALGDSQRVRLVLTGSLTCPGPNSQTIEVWKHEHDVAEIVPAALRARTLNPTIRKGIDAFFDEFVEAHQKACGATSGSSSPAAK